MNEGYEDEDAAYEEEGDWVELERYWDEVDGCVMQVEILSEAETQFSSSTIPKLDNTEDEWEWRGT
eukprot:6978997-Prorocentrum_lima.AAC.1